MENQVKFFLLISPLKTGFRSNVLCETNPLLQIQVSIDIMIFEERIEINAYSCFVRLHIGQRTSASVQSKV